MRFWKWKELSINHLWMLNSHAYRKKLWHVAAFCVAHKWHFLKHYLLNNLEEIEWFANSHRKSLPVCFKECFDADYNHKLHFSFFMFQNKYAYEDQILWELILDIQVIWEEILMCSVYFLISNHQYFKCCMQIFLFTLKTIVIIRYIYHL